MKNFDFASPQTIEQAVALLSPDARPIAGGTDLLAQMKNETIQPSLLVDLQNISALHGIIETADGLQIGACTPIADVLAWPTLGQGYTLLAQACQHVAWPEIRTMGTLGGNLCQRPRCWYFRHPLGTRCLKRGGDLCYPTAGRADGPFAIFNGGPCHAVHPSDIAPALVAMDAMVSIASATGQRTLPLADFFSSDDVMRENILQPKELLVAIHVPKPKAETRAVFLKSKRRPSHDFARASVALSALMQDGVCVDVRLVLGSVALKPWRLNVVEQRLIGQRIDAALAAQAAQLAVQAAKPLISARGTTNAAKIKLTQALVQRALNMLTAPSRRDSDGQALPPLAV